MLKSLSTRRSDGSASRAVSNASRTIPTLPSSRARGVTAFSSAVNSGMITTSLMASHSPITPAKSATSRRIRSSMRRRTSAVDSPISHVGASVCHTSGCPLTTTPRSANQRAVASRRRVSGRPSSGSNVRQ